jgi:hypothetical protein
LETVLMGAAVEDACPGFKNPVPEALVPRAAVGAALGEALFPVGRSGVARQQGYRVRDGFCGRVELDC